VQFPLLKVFLGGPLAVAGLVCSYFTLTMHIKNQKGDLY